jgi:hypothetical protein
MKLNPEALKTVNGKIIDGVVEGISDLAIELANQYVAWREAQNLIEQREIQLINEEGDRDCSDDLLTRDEEFQAQYAQGIGSVVMGAMIVKSDGTLTGKFLNENDFNVHTSCYAASDPRLMMQQQLARQQYQDAGRFNEIVAAGTKDIENRVARAQANFDAADAAVNASQGYINETRDSADQSLADSLEALQLGTDTFYTKAKSAIARVGLTGRAVSRQRTAQKVYFTQFVKPRITNAIQADLIWGQLEPAEQDTIMGTIMDKAVAFEYVKDPNPVAIPIPPSTDGGPR